MYDEFKPKHLNHKQAAKYLGWSPRTLYNRVSQGDIPRHKLFGGKFNWYKISELDALIKRVR